MNRKTFQVYDTYKRCNDRELDMDGRIYFGMKGRIQRRLGLAVAEGKTSPLLWASMRRTGKRAEWLIDMRWPGWLEARRFQTDLQSEMQQIPIVRVKI